MRKLAVLALLMPALALAAYDTIPDTLGNWRCTFSNFGPWAYPSPYPGGYWNDSEYIYGAGLWVGAINGPDTLVTVGYNPNSAKSEIPYALRELARRLRQHRRPHLLVSRGLAASARSLPNGPRHSAFSARTLGLLLRLGPDSAHAAGPASGPGRPAHGSCLPDGFRL